MGAVEEKRLIATFMNYAGGKPLTESLLSTIYNDWNMLMGVVKKIDSYANEQMTFAEFDNYRNEWRMIDNPSKYPIDRVFKQVVQFIEWYNKNNNNDRSSN
jgi:hypothetical protein